MHREDILLWSEGACWCSLGSGARGFLGRGHRSTLLELFLDELGGAYLRDEGVSCFDDDTLLDRSGDLEAIFILYPSGISLDACYTSSSCGIEEAYCGTYA